MKVGWSWRSTELRGVARLEVVTTRRESDLVELGGFGFRQSEKVQVLQANVGRNASGFPVGHPFYALVLVVAQQFCNTRRTAQLFNEQSVGFDSDVLESVHGNSKHHVE